MKKRSANIRAKLLPVGAFCLILLIWWGLSASGMIPGYMLPSPADVVGAFIHDFPNLMHHAFVSVTEALLGLLIQRHPQRIVGTDERLGNVGGIHQVLS